MHELYVICLYGIIALVHFHLFSFPPTVCVLYVMLYCFYFVLVFVFGLSFCGLTVAYFLFFFFSVFIDIISIYHRRHKPFWRRGMWNVHSYDVRCTLRPKFINLLSFLVARHVIKRAKRHSTIHKPKHRNCFHRIQKGP